MKRRAFITLLCGTAVGLPFAARAQQRDTPVIGFLDSRSPGEAASVVPAFRKGLNEVGFVDGQNVKIEYRWAEGQYDRLPALAADLIHGAVAVIFAGGPAAAPAAKTATATIPIVFVNGLDPVKFGLVASLNRPGGNVTGVSWFSSLVAGKGLGLLHELVPNAALIGLLANPKLPEAERTRYDAQEAARALGLQLLVLNASTAGEINAAFATMRQRRADAILVGSDPFFSSRLQQIVTLAERDAIPTMFLGNREFVEDGGLMHIAPLESMWDAFSAARPPPICRLIRPPNSNS